ncbi:MAG: endonuclease III [Candidatus Bathyarchaeota archaeon]|nr:MAG: endonuclease III [Candidatus Bathyarchaeota archaeon]
MSRDEEILKRLLENYKRPWRPKAADPFRSLVRIILSQNTNYKNESTAYSRLESSVGAIPESLAAAPIEAIAEAIKPAGMYNRRSVVLKNVAEEVLARFDGDLTQVLVMPYEEAREELMGLTGVGYKTADVLLMFDAGKQIIPVDRHIFRISKRLGIVPENAGYEQVRSALESTAPTGRHEDVHVLLIQFGRDICRALRPKCGGCFLRDLCPYPN